MILMPSTNPEEWHYWDSFIRFTKRQLETLDYDPFHPMLWEMQKGMDREGGLWSSFLYMAFYNIGSSYCAWTSFKPVTKPPVYVDKWAIGVQRRNLRASSVSKHIGSLVAKAEQHGGIYEYLTHRFSGKQEEDWHRLIEALEAVWGNGRWGAYTTAELMQKVNKVPVIPADLGLDGATGPRRGLSALLGVNTSTRTDVLQSYGERLLDKLQGLFPDPKIKWARNGVDYAMTESLLCDFYGLTKGRYYIGRDIDRAAGRIKAQEQKTDIDMSGVWKTRENVFPKYLLAEQRNTVLGIDNVRTKAFAQNGVLADYADDFMLMM
tara:strand:- start:1814 stop:2776 length:963 start_codon:yes stop_codon:yes gene_type:complete